MEKVSMEYACCPTQYSQQSLARSITALRIDLGTRTLDIFDRFEAEVFDQLREGGLAMFGEFDEVGDAIDVEEFNLLGELDEFLLVGGGELVGVSLLDECGEALMEFGGEGMMDFVEEFSFWVDGGLRGFFGGKDTDLEGLTFGEVGLRMPAS
jgi:hypothetical protein